MSYDIKLNKDKSQIRLKEISYVGHILSQDGIKPEPRKVQAIMKLEIPENKEELQRFLGMITYLSKFILNYSQTLAPLRTLLEKDCEWHWEEQQNVAFSAHHKCPCAEVLDGASFTNSSSNLVSYLAKKILQKKPPAVPQRIKRSGAACERMEPKECLSAYCTIPLSLL